MPAIPPSMDQDTEDDENYLHTQQSTFHATTQTNQHTKRKRSNGSPSPANIDVAQLGENRFALLAGLEIENAEEALCQRKTTTTISKNKSYCPPIFLFNVNIKRLVEQLEAKSPKIDFKIKNVNKHKSKLYLSDALVHAEMMNILREKNIQSYSYTPKEFKQISFVLRGLYYDMDVDEIKTALDNVVPDTIERVTNFTTPHSIKNAYFTGRFLITLKTGKTLSDISHIKYLLSQTVSWEKPNKKEKEVQCHRCQRWGHIAKNCNSEFKCVKCDKKHIQGECQRTQNEASDPFCVNCGESGHPANWRGCAAYKKFIESRKDRIRKIQEEKNIAKNNVNKAISNPLYSPGKSYASLFHTKTTQEPKEKPSFVTDFLKLASFFLEPEELSLEQQIKNFLNSYKNMSKLEAKTEFLRLLNKIKNEYDP